MFPSFCGPAGLAGWLVMLLVWTGLVALVVWGVARLFPDRARPGRPAQPQPEQSEQRSSAIGSGLR